MVIIPAYNEQHSIKDVYEELKKSSTKPDVVVINDCSTDKTNEILEANKINHINLPINLGIGGAMQTGYRYALENGYDYAIQVDGDGQHLPSEIEKLFVAMEKGNANLVIGSRFVSKTDYSGSVSRRFGITIFSLITKLLIGQSIKDATSGFRLVDKKVIKYFAENYPTDYPEPEVLVPLNKLGIKIIETPRKYEGKGWWKVLNH